MPGSSGKKKNRESDEKRGSRLEETRQVDALCTICTNVVSMEAGLVQYHVPCIDAVYTLRRKGGKDRDGVWERFHSDSALGITRTGPL